MLELGSGTVWIESLIKTWDLVGAVGSEVSGSLVDKSKMPVAPLNLPSPPVMVIVAEPVLTRFSKSIAAVPLMVPNSLSLPFPKNVRVPIGKPSKPNLAGSEPNVNTPVPASNSV
jgi:hypothetical protein